jgi:hypothetical protein
LINLFNVDFIDLVLINKNNLINMFFRHVDWVPDKN